MSPPGPDRSTASERDLLACGDVARLLGVAPATLKRWTDAGRLPCIRTAGGHRRFDPADVERLRLRLGAGHDALARWVDGLLQDPDAALSAALLLEHERLGAWWKVAEALGDVLREMGQRLERGAWCMVEEHAASERLGRALARVGEDLRPRSDKPRALLATAEGDDHTLGLSLVELCLRERGWRALWARRATLAAEVVAAVGRGEIDAVVLSASSSSPPEALRAEAAQVGGACAARGVPVLLGGGGPWPAWPGGPAVERTFGGLVTWASRLEESSARQPGGASRG